MPYYMVYSNRMNSPKTLIFVGRSGAGKGTQLELLKVLLSEKYPETKVCSLDMGNIYRAFFKNEGYVQDIARDLSMNQGKFQPDFLTNALFVSNAVTFIDGTSHVIIDGFPRSVSQLGIVRELLDYTKRAAPTVINIEVSREDVKERMLKRGRGDDSSEKIDSRLDEYDRTVVPMLASMAQDSFFSYVEIDGSRVPELVHADLVAKLGL